MKIFSKNRFSMLTGIITICLFMGGMVFLNPDSGFADSEAFLSRSLLLAGDSSGTPSTELNNEANDDGFQETELLSNNSLSESSPLQDTDFTELNRSLMMFQPAKQKNEEPYPPRTTVAVSDYYKIEWDKYDAEIEGNYIETYITDNDRCPLGAECEVKIVKGPDLEKGALVKEGDIVVGYRPLAVVEDDESDVEGDDWGDDFFVYIKDKFTYKLISTDPDTGITEESQETEVNIIVTPPQVEMTLLSDTDPPASGKFSLSGALSIKMTNEEIPALEQVKGLDMDLHLPNLGFSIPWFDPIDPNTPLESSDLSESVNRSAPLIIRGVDIVEFNGENLSGIDTDRVPFEDDGTGENEWTGLVLQDAAGLPMRAYWADGSFIEVSTILLDSHTVAYAGLWRGNDYWNFSDDLPKNLLYSVPGDAPNGLTKVTFPNPTWDPEGDIQPIVEVVDDGKSTLIRTI